MVEGPDSTRETVMESKTHHRTVATSDAAAAPCRLPCQYTALRSLHTTLYSISSSLTLLHSPPIAAPLSASCSTALYC